ncbi:hypothetical protein [Maribacter aquivivus]|uniref:hypothetical protein n=1 Tax=Maribacter aquivivus TaxID=228958 RepID=UPI00248FC6D7|nr:hypothetical protein [Maribacter aquivivus]
MSKINPDLLEVFLKNEMLQLMPKSFTIKKASKLTGLPEEEIKIFYLNVRSRITKEAINRGIVYLLISSIFTFVGYKSLVEESSTYFLIGMFFLGVSGILTAIGYFILAIKGKSK